LIQWDWAPPEIYKGFDRNGARVRIDPEYGVEPYEQRDGSKKYLNNSIDKFLAAVETGADPAVSGDDLRHALEVAVASKLSATRGNAPVRLPVEDRSLTLFPSAYRWSGGDQTGNPQPAEEALHFAVRK
jgi:hypothetical protein